MQISSYDKNNRLIFASQAKKHQDYYCVECNGVVRLRGGYHRQKHFFHLNPPKKCRQNGKGIVHLRIQEYLQNLLGRENSSMEFRFPKIRRIADIVWHQEKLVFEIQYSPIKACEVSERNSDYAREGYQVIWIFHEKNFNQYRFSAAEVYLRNSPHYYTNIDLDGQGYIYDQFDILHKGRRFFQSRAVVISPSKILKFSFHQKEEKLGVFINNRVKHWPFSFSGDILSLSLSLESKPLDLGILEFIQNAEENFSKKYSMTPAKVTLPYILGKIFEHLIKRPSIIFFRMLLERACRS
jgi:competence protein CoiA